MNLLKLFNEFINFRQSLFASFRKISSVSILNRMLISLDHIILGVTKKRF